MWKSRFNEEQIIAILKEIGRPALGELMADARRSRFDLVLVSASGRLTFSLWIGG